MNGLLSIDEEEKANGLLSTYQDPEYQSLYDSLSIPKGFSFRQPYKSELDFFKKNPSVSGMATDDNFVILNKYSNLKPQEFQSVANNEAARLFMRQSQVPEFSITPEQKKSFKGTSYESAPEAELRATILARILSGDPSIKSPTKEQIDLARKIKEQMGF